MYSPRPNLKTTCFCLQNTLRKLLSTSAVAQKSHYDSLGITPSATQADVKSAYYKLSKIHHPDRNAGSESSSQKFQEVSAAYEVLGNVKLRKMYDKGLISGPGVHQTPPEDPKAKFYRSREVRTRAPPPDGRTPIYDFDEWSRQHYGATFAKDMHLKHRKRMRQMTYQHAEWHKKNERFVVGFFAILCMLGYVFSESSSYDQVRTDNDEVKKKPR